MRYYAGLDVSLEETNDARALAQIMRTGWYQQVHVKSEEARRWRSLLVARRAVLNEIRTIENSLPRATTRARAFALPRARGEARHAKPEGLR